MMVKKVELKLRDPAEPRHTGPEPGENIMCACGQPVKTHPRCQACGGFGYNGAEDCELKSIIREFRGRQLCPGCIRRWQAIEKKAGQETEFKYMASDKIQKARQTVMFTPEGARLAK